MLVLREALLFYRWSLLVQPRGFSAVLQNSAPSQEASLIQGAEHEVLVRGLVSVETALPSPLAPHPFSAVTEPARRGGSPCLGWVLCLISIGLLKSHFTLKTNPSEGYNPNMSETECRIGLTSPHFGWGDAASFSLTWLSQGLSRRKSHI